MTEIRTRSGDGSSKAPRSRGRSAKAHLESSLPPDGGHSAPVRGAPRDTTSSSAPDTPAADGSTDASVRVIGVVATDRDSLISLAAYYRAERRNFEPGQELEDWLAAEAEIDSLLSPAAKGARSV